MAALRSRTIYASRDPLVRFLFSRSKKKPSETAEEESKETKDPDEITELPEEEKHTKETLLEDMDADPKKEAILKATKTEPSDAETEGVSEKPPPMEESEKPYPMEESEKPTPKLAGDGKVANAMELPITIEEEGNKNVVLSVSPKDSVVKLPKPKVSVWRRAIPSLKKKGVETPVPEGEVDAVATWFNRTFVPATNKSNALETVSSLVVKNFSQGHELRDKETIKTRVTRNIKGHKGNWSTVLPQWGKQNDKLNPQLWYTAVLPFRILPQQTTNEVVSSNYFRLITKERSIEASSLTSGVPPPPTPALWPVGKMTGSSITDLFGKQEPWYKRSPLTWLRKPPDPWWKKAITPWLKMPYARPNPFQWTLIKRMMAEFVAKRTAPKLALKPAPKPAIPPAKPKK